VLHHYWMNSFKVLYQKHLRYLKLEGKAQYDKGRRYTFKRHIKSSISAFYDSYVIYQGWKDGLIGLFLSLFYCWYIFSCWSELRKYQMNNFLIN
jgi:hypothetical protein